MMKVVHLACVAPPEIGGIGSVAYREVALLRARGVDARLIAPEPARLYGEESVERSFVDLVKPTLRIGNASFLPHIVSTIGQADVLHLHYPFYGTQEWLWLTQAHLPPMVISFHMDATAPGFKGLAFAAHRLLIQPWIFRRAAKILVASFDYAKRSSLQSTFRASPSKIAELPFGVDTDFFSSGPSQRPRFGLTESSSLILFVGGLDRAHAFKGLEDLLHAFASLDTSPQLCIIGDGDLKPTYQALTRTLGISSRVHFFGRVDQATLRDAYRTADVCVLPSTNAAEAFGLVLLEAQACGVPVIASDVPGVRTVVRQGETGLLVPPRDRQALASALSQMLANPEARTLMGQRAQTFVHEHFSWDKHVDGLMDLYRTVCASPS